MSWLKNNWKLVTLITIFLILNNFNYLFGFVQTTKNHLTFSALPVVNSADYYVYLSYVEQGRQGHLFMHNLYNHLNQTRLFFAPQWFLIGQLEALFQLSNVFIYFLARILFGIILILLIYKWLKKIFPEPHNWWWQLGLILFANGFGAIVNPWLLKIGNSATNLWMPETNLFSTLTQSPLLILSQVLILLTFYLLVLAWQNKNLTYLMLAALSSALLAILHPYDAVICASVLLIWGAWIYHDERNKKILLYLTCLAVPNIIIAAYYTWLKADLVVQQYNQQNILPSPPLISYVFGLGLILPLSIGGIIYLFKNKKINNSLKLMIIWAILPWFLIYSPLDFNRRLSNGWHIPLMIMALIFVQYLYKIIRPLWRLIFCMFIFTALTFDSFYYTVDSLYRIKSNITNYYFDSERLTIYRQIKQQSNFGDIILSRNNDANMLPAFTGRKVYLGHNIQTYEFDQKNLEVKKIWSTPQDISEWLKNRQIKFIFASHDLLPEFQDIRWLAEEKYIEAIVDNERYIFYRVKY